ncbi:dihydrofolate synthase / folylpolyglutamate synthase [Pilibacter termitis]|uniref:tetrahydrofolate synthase n=1 Tax=Pilibacter termitis TaxID=263852 RepID=A0A1T4L2Y5_9ENTE|nr:folylpolyglutamate synthase/dihydrofolate synthase family protein [Pilibacter termitis]SJZ48880.1 dihydrofolate synthase / folylpolyglutamate synthase [Pilibacter termitis]
MKIEETLSWIHSRKKFGSRPGLVRVEALLERLGNPEKQLSMIHIAGTNGKGSTVAFLRSILQKQGLRVATFTSPYIEHFNERMSINGVGIENQKLIEYVEEIRPFVETMDENEELSGITEFEIITALAFLYFARENVDVVIVEVGLGGLLDSTNVIAPVLTGITTIGLDHQDILGDSLIEIAEQKAGIIKKNVPLVTGNIGTTALSVIEGVARKEQAELIRFGREYSIRYDETTASWGETFDYFSGKFSLYHATISMLGQHQTENAAMALTLARKYAEIKCFSLSEEVILSGLKAAFWAGRMEKIHEHPLIILDGAHNPHAMKRLVENVQREFPEKRVNILFSALQTKDVTQMLEQLLTLENAHLYLTTFDYPQAIELKDFHDLDKEKRVDFVSVWQFGLAEILEKMREDEVFLVTGSLYFISQVRKFLIKMEKV